MASSSHSPQLASHLSLDRRMGSQARTAPSCPSSQSASERHTVIILPSGATLLNSSACYGMHLFSLACSAAASCQVCDLDIGLSIGAAFRFKSSTRPSERANRVSNVGCLSERAQPSTLSTETREGKTGAADECAQSIEASIMIRLRGQSKLLSRHNTTRCPHFVSPVG